HFHRCNPIAKTRRLIERDYSDSITRTQRFNKTVRGRAYQSHVVACRTRRVEKQGYFEWCFRGAEVGDRLCLAVFDDPEIFSFQIRERMAGSVGHNCGHGDKLCVSSDDVTFVDLVRGLGTLLRFSCLFGATDASRSLCRLLRSLLRTRSLDEDTRRD